MTAQSFHDPIPQTRLFSLTRCCPLALTPREREPPSFRTVVSTTRELDPRVSNVNRPSAFVRFWSHGEQKLEDQKPFPCTATTKLRTAFKELQRAPFMSTDVGSKEPTRAREPRSARRSRACNDSAFQVGTGRHYTSSATAQQCQCFRKGQPRKQ